MPEAGETYQQGVVAPAEEQGGFDPRRIMDYTVRWISHFEQQYERFVHPRIRKNFQLLMNYDEDLERRRRLSQRIARHGIVIPKVQPEIFTRMANVMAAVRSANPVFRCAPPKGADARISLQCAEIEDGINDLMDSDDWFDKYYAIEFWGSLSPYVALEILWEKQIEYVPTQEVEQGREFETTPDGYVKLDGFGAQQYDEMPRLRFEEQVFRCGGKAKALLPWETFFDYTCASIGEAPITFIRRLLSNEDVQEKIDNREWIEPPSGWKQNRRANRNWGLEILRSVPNKGIDVSDAEYDRERHEVLQCNALAYSAGRRQKTIHRWFVLDREHILRMPEETGFKRFKLPLLIYNSKPIPGTQLGISPAEALSQIMRASDYVFNKGMEAMDYGLYNSGFIGQGMDFVEENPIQMPGEFIPFSGDVSQIKPMPPSYSPEKVFGYLNYLDGKGQLVSDVNDTALGVQKSPSPDKTAFQVGEEKQALSTKLGLFITLDSHKFLSKWLEALYWVTLEKNPVHFTLKGRNYDLRNWVIPGGPQFDLPQVGEVSGRASDRVMLNAAFSILAQNPVFVDPALTEEVNPRLFALLKKWAYAQGYTWIEEVLNPEPAEVKVPPIPPEVVAAIMQQRGQTGETDGQRPDTGLGAGAGSAQGIGGRAPVAG